jgi:hypothetical protein
MDKAAVTTGLIAILIGITAIFVSSIPAFRYYSIIGPIVGAMFIVAGIVLVIYGLLKK